jgi:hypothetical protein
VSVRRTIRRIWKRLPGVDLARQIPADNVHRLGQCRDPRCPYTGWHAP